MKFSRPLLLALVLLESTSVGAQPAARVDSPPSALPPPPAAAAPPAPVAALAPAARAMHFREFMVAVARGNLEALAVRASLPVAQAQVTVARAFPDPTLSLNVGSVDVSLVGAQNAYGASISVPVEWFTRRPARIEAARSDVRVAEAQFQVFLRTLYGTAAEAFIDALSARLVLERKRLTLESLRRLVSVNEQRLRSGDVGRLAVVQARVEAERYHGEVLGAETDVRVSSLALQGLLGAAAPGAITTGVEPLGSLRMPARALDLEALVREALRDRADLRAYRLAIEAAEARRRLAHANRGVDVTLNLGWQYYTPTDATGFGPVPGYHTLYGGISVPLPISRIYSGEVQSAEATIAQARATLAAAERAAEVEMRSAVARYRGAVARLALYTESLLGDAEQVLAATLYSYQRGEATLLEVLNAQRTLNDVQLAWIDSLTEHAKALAQVQVSLGRWTLELLPE